MTDLESTIGEALDKLRSGQYQNADNLLASALDQYQQEQSRLRGTPQPPAPPRPANVIVCNLFRLICSHVGSPQPLEAMVRELEERTLEEN